MSLTVKIEFGGGLELLFSNQKSHKITIPAKTPAGEKSESERPTDLRYLIFWLKDNLLKEREELFAENGTVYAVLLLFLL